MLTRPNWPSRRSVARVARTVGYPSSPSHFVRVAPFIVICLLVSWILTILTSKLEYGYESRLVFHVPDLTGSVDQVLSSLFTAPLLNRGPQQVIYVTMLLLTFGVLVESREGSLRTMLLFFGTTAIGAITAAIILHIIYPGIVDHPALATAWSGAWSGGSAGAFGLAGAFAARQHRPWPWMLAFLVWEAHVATLRLRNYTPVFHLIALAAGYIITRYFLRPRAEEIPTFRTA